MQPILEMFLKVLDHTKRQRSVNLAGTIIAADPRQIHNLAALRSARARSRRFWWAGNGVGAGGDEVRFHQGFEGGVWVAAAEGRHAGVEPGRGTWL